MRNKTETVIYCRVSHPSQVTRGHGLDGQERANRDYARRVGYKVVQVFKEPGISGEITERPVMRELLDYLEKRPPSAEPIVVLIDDLKRLARNTEGHLLIRKTIYSRNARLESPTHRFEDSPGGRFVETVLAAAAQLEREQNKEQVKRRMKARLSDGYWCFPATPPGYHMTRSRTQGKIAKPIEQKQTIIKETMEGYAEGRFPTKVDVQQFIIRKKLYDDSNVTVEMAKRLLERSLFYAGWLEYQPWDIKPRKAHHKSIISFETHLLVQKRLNGCTRTQLRKDDNPDFPLRRAVLCRACDTPITGSWVDGRAKRYPKYWCRNKICAHYGKTYKKDEIEKDLLRLLSSLAPTENTIRLAKAILVEKWDKKLSELKDKCTDNKRRQAQLSKKIDSLLERAAETSSERVARSYEARVENLEQEATILESNYTKIQPHQFNFKNALDMVIDFISSPHQTWQNGDFKSRQRVLQMCFQEPLRYDRDKGFKNPDLSLTYAILSGNTTLNNSGCGHGRN